MKVLRISTLVILTLILSQCGSINPFSSGGADYSSSEITPEVRLIKIDDNGKLLVIMPVSEFVDDTNHFGESVFDIELNGEQIIANEKGANHYVYDFSQFATQYSEVQYTLNDVQDGDVVTVYITSADGAEVAFEGAASSSEETKAILIVAE